MADSPGRSGSDTGALEGRGPDHSVVLPAHQPKQVFRRLAVNLVMAGHMHGGQIQPFGKFVRLVRPAVAGLELKRQEGPNAA